MSSEETHLARCYIGQSDMSLSVIAVIVIMLAAVFAVFWTDEGG